MEAPAERHVTHACCFEENRRPTHPQLQRIDSTVVLLFLTPLEIFLANTAYKFADVCTTVADNVSSSDFVNKSLAQRIYLRLQTRGHSLECIPPSRHVQISTVSYRCRRAAGACTHKWSGLMSQTSSSAVVPLCAMSTPAVAEWSRLERHIRLTGKLTISEICSRALSNFNQLFCGAKTTRFHDNSLVTFKRYSARKHRQGETTCGRHTDAASVVRWNVTGYLAVKSARRQ